MHQFSWLLTVLIPAAVWVLALTRTARRRAVAFTDSPYPGYAGFRVGPLHPEDLVAVETVHGELLGAAPSVTHTQGWGVDQVASDLLEVIDADWSEVSPLEIEVSPLEIEAGRREIEARR